MSSRLETQKQWLLATIICGALAAACYLVAIFVPMPSLKASYWVFMLFGPAFCCAMWGIYKHLRVAHDSIPLQLGTVLLVLAGAINTIMAAMQGALRIYFDRLPHDKEAIGDVGYSIWKMGLHSGNSLQMGVDVAWDYFVLPGMFLLGIALAGRGNVGRLFGWSAIALGAAGMVFNSWTFPDPPGSAGLVDVGPFCGAWFALLVIRLMWTYRSLNDNPELNALRF